MAINDDTLRQIEKARRALNAAVDGVDHDLLRAWTQAWNEITAEWRAVTLELAAMSKDGRWPSRAQITRATRAAEVLKLTRARMEELGKVLNVRVTTALPDVVADANRVANRLTRTQLPSGAAGNVIKTNLLDPKALDAIVARTTGRVHALSKPLSALAEQSMKATLIRGVIVGDNPNRAASIMVSRVKGDFDGGLNRARVISRTEMLDANRTAALAHDKANADILQGWQWVSALDSRTCPSCWSQHGGMHAIDEPGPEDHQQGRCVRVPVTKPWSALGVAGLDKLDEPASKLPDARKMFDALPQPQRVSILGQAKVDLLDKGDIAWADLSTKRITPGWRDSWAPTPLADLVR